MRKTRSAASDTQPVNRIVTAGAAMLTALVTLVSLVVLLQGRVAVAAPAAHATLASQVPVAAAPTEEPGPVADQPLPLPPMGSLAPAAIAAPLAPTNTTTTIGCTVGPCPPTPDDPDPSVVGQSYSVTFYVQPSPANGHSVDGTITVTDGSGASCAVTYDSAFLGPAPNGWQTACSLASTSAGNKTLTATFVPANSSLFNGSSDTEPHQVNPAGTQTVLTFSPASPNACQPTTLTATVSAVAPGTGTPTGTVTFHEDATVLGTATLSGGVATLSLNLSAGTHSITATYAGSANYNGSTSSPPQSVTVTKAKPTVILTTSPSSPQVFGTSVTLTAEVQGVGSCGTPTGHVFFNDNGVVIGTGALDTNGRATLVVPLFSTGSHLLKAVYESDNDSYQDSESTSQTYEINRRATTTGLVSSVNPSVWGQSVTFTTTVSSAIPVTPTGQVLFRDGGTVIATGTLDGSGRAVFSTASLEVATHTITAAYQGDENFLPSTGNLSQTVNKADTTATVSCNSSSSVYGESITCTASVTANPPGAGIPTGEVEFHVDGGLQATVTLGFGNPGEATWTTAPGDATPLPVGNRSITVYYLGDSHFNTSDNTGSPLSHSVGKASTTVDLQDPLPDPTDFGQPVQLSAVVQVQSPGLGTPTGTVRFTIDNPAVDPIDVALQSGSTSASTTTTDILQGTHNITAQYLGDGNFFASAVDTETHTVNKTPTRTTLSATPSSSVYGQDVTLTALVEPTGSSVSVPAPPSGSVTFKADDGSGAVTLGTATLVPSGDTATATFVASTSGLWPLDAASYTLTAEFPEDANFQASSDDLPFVIGPDGTSTVLSSSAAGNSSQVGDAVTFTATVTSNNGETPTGTLTFRRNGSPITGCTNLTLDGAGQATCTLTSLPEGAFNFQAAYNGAPNFTASTSSTITHRVTAKGSTTTLSSSTASATYGDNVTFTAVVVDSTTSNPITSGNVVFRDGVLTLATVALNGAGTAVFNTSSLATPLSVGAHTISATFEGTSEYAGSSDDVSLTVTQGTSQITLSSSANPSVFGQQVVFTAQVQPTSGSGSPTGQVTFTLPSPVGVVVRNLSGGSASLAANNLPAGSHVIQAEYGGDTNFSGAGPTSLSPNQVVNPDTTKTTVTTSPNPSVIGQGVTFQATVVVDEAVPTPGAGIPSGSVQFSVDSVNVGSAVPLTSGTASYAYAGFSSTGPHTVAAAYISNSANYQNSSGSTTHNVGDTPADLSVTKADNPDPVNAGADLTYDISVTNGGPSQNVVLTDTLPSQVTFQSLTSGSWTCTDPGVGNTGQVVCQRLPMPASTTEALTIVVNVPAATPAGVVLRNHIVVAGDRPDTNMSNNTFVQETTVFRSPRLMGDCNADDQLSTTDIYAIVDDIFDLAYQGPATCDANADAKVDAGDVPCTALLIAEGACSAEAGAQLKTQAGQPSLELPDQLPALPGTRVAVPVQLATNGNVVSSLVFSVDYDESWLSFDPLDANADGVPDAITLNLPADYDAQVTFNAADTDGEIDIFVADIAAPLVALPSGTVMFIRLDVDHNPPTPAAGVQFSANPRGSFGSAAGQSVPGTFTPVQRVYRYLPFVLR